MMKKKDYSKPRPSLAEQELYKKLNVEATRKMQEDFKKHPFTSEEFIRQSRGESGSRKPAKKRSMSEEAYAAFEKLLDNWI